MACPIEQLDFGAQRFPIHHLPRRDGGTHRAGVQPAARPVDHPQTDRAESGAGGAHGRAANAFGEKRHTHHGRRADFEHHHTVHPAVGQLGKRLYLDSARRAAGHRRARFLRRLAQSGLQRPERRVRQIQNGVAEQCGFGGGLRAVLSGARQ